MTTTYLLPCTCGEKLRIDVSQAGLDVRCRCGKDVKAPTFRGLSQLERVEEAPAVKPAPEWGARHRLLLGGAVVALCGLVFAAGAWRMIPPYPTFIVAPKFVQSLDDEIKAMAPDKVFEQWEQLASEELDRSAPFDLGAYHHEVTRMRGFVHTGLAIAVIGAIILLSSLFVGGKQKKRPAPAHS